MADTDSQPQPQPQPQRAEIRPEIRLWVLGLLTAAGLALLAGVLWAVPVEGVVRPWAGVGLLAGAGLAAIVGVSKTSSA